MTYPTRKLLIVEDDPLVAGLLRESLIDENFQIEIAHTAADATGIAAKFDPDIAILDINLGRGATGVDLAFILNQQYPGIALLILTQHPDLRTAGFDPKDIPPGTGFLRKDAVLSKIDILNALSQLVSNLSLNVRQDFDPARPLAKLTATQIEVLRMVAQGYTNQEIANRRGTSTRAVEQVLNSIFLTLAIDVNGNINPRVEAVRQFISSAGTPDRD